MATTRQYPLHDRLLEGVDTTLPAHLIGQQWRTQHNVRMTPQLVQMPFKVLSGSAVPLNEPIMAIVNIPTGTSGYGRVTLLTPTRCFNSSGALLGSFPSDGAFRRFSYFIYGNSLYYSNEVCGIRVTDGASDNVLITEDPDPSYQPKARFIIMWYDHILAAMNSPIGAKIMMSDLYWFNYSGVSGPHTSRWKPDATNECDFYDFLEWQVPEYPFFGVTGLAKIGATAWLYTPTALIPIKYVGLPKVFQIEESQIIQRIGNTFQWTMVPTPQGHFFYDAIEHMFFVFDGQSLPKPIGEPIRGYIKANLNSDLNLAAKMFGYVDVDNREIWWNFVSNASSGDFDKSVVFNYRYGKWYTASNENILSFCGGTNPGQAIDDLVGAVDTLSGPVSQLGHSAAGIPRQFGTALGTILREEFPSDTADMFLPCDNPVLESGDFHYNDIFTTKEVDAMVINAIWTPGWSAIYLTDENGNYIIVNGKRIIVKYVPYTGADDAGLIEVKVRGRAYLGDNVIWADSDRVGNWYPDLQDSKLDFPSKWGRVMRYRFEGMHVRQMIFSAYSDGVRMGKAEQ